MSVSRASCGLCLPCPADLPSAIQVANASGYDFVAVPVVHPRYRMPEQIAEKSTMTDEDDDDAAVTETTEAKDAPGKGEGKGEIAPRQSPFTRSDYLMSSADWSALVMGVVGLDSAGIESANTAVRRRAEERLKRELMFSQHLGLTSVMITLTRGNNANLSRVINSFLLKASSAGPIVMVRLPMRKQASLVEQKLAEENGGDDTWQWWDTFRCSVNFEKRLCLALEVASSDCLPDDASLKRWLGEPVKALVINTRIYLTNKKGFPVLPRSVQDVVRPFICLDVQVIIEGRSHGHNMCNYQQYLAHLWNTSRDDDPVNRYAKGFEDFLQAPLQPLMDNLESGTYEVFEKDPVKYTEYQRAIYNAIRDKVPDDAADRDKRLTVMVLGAGRGPLVRASLQAASYANRKIKVFAVEKNTNAVVTLLTQKEEEWKDEVDVISSDMRDWRPRPEDRADIVVSELLGSFGDNELSPECLYSAQHLFKPDAISIPTSYTSWIGPLQSSKLYNEVRQFREPERSSVAPYETPYVVRFQNRTDLAEPKPLFTFEHPLRTDIDNNRYGSVSFTSLIDGQLHGFGGYFECVLYKDVMISINPSTHSEGMFSWFPIFFPIKNPLKVLKGQEIELHFWRLNNGKKVWYEWSITKPAAIPIHNPNGRSYTIGL